MKKIYVSWYCPDCMKCNKWELMKAGLMRNALRVIDEHKEQTPNCTAELPRIELTYEETK